MALAAGDRLGHYEIVATIGAGGMGEVYRAKDTKLEREVAIKVLPAELAQDPERLTRFGREAKVLAALNHPNIATIYGVEESNGIRALVMELVPGAPVKGPVTLQTALRQARQIADALEVAHDKGIVHRDLKPANIMVTPDGVVKVLDFGLAAVAQPSTASTSEPHDSPTSTIIDATQAGAIMGSVAYMSPEQAAGKPVDKRTDIWSFGVVLWEMLTGKKLFDGETMSHTLAAVLTKEPDLELVPAETRRLLQRCLEKDPRKRLRDIGDAMPLLEDAPAARGPAPVGRTTMLVLVASCVVLAAAAATDIALRWTAGKAAQARPLTRLSVDLGPEAYDSPRQTFAISPDGTRIAFQSRTARGAQLSLLSLNQAKAVPIPGTENGTGPFFSPDGQWLAFVAFGKLMKISLQGGAPVFVADVSTMNGGADWGPDGRIVGTMESQTEPGTQTGLSRVSDSGGAPQPLTRPTNGEATHRWPQFLPGGEYVLFTAHTILDDFDSASLEVVSVKTGVVKTVLRGGYYGRYIPSGHLIYLQDGVLYGVRFDLSTLEARGPAKPLLDDVAVSIAWGTGRFDFSQTGVFVYRKPVATAWPIVWMDSLGKTKPLLTAPRAYYTPRFSPDGQKLAVSDGGITRGNIFVYDIQRDTTAQITSDAQGHFSPVWAPDGKHLVYRSHYSSTGDYALEWTRADGGGAPQRLLTGKSVLQPSSFSKDGRHLAYVQGATAYDIWTLPVDVSDPEHPKAGEPEPFVKTPANELEPAFSPDGRWMAYVSNEARRGWIMYVRPFPIPKDAPDRKWAVAPATADFPVWSRSRNELFYVNPSDAKIMVLSYSTAGDSFVVERPRVWSPQPIFETELFSFSMDLFPDGKRFATFPVPDKRDERDAVTRLSVLQNFFDEVRRRVP